MAALVAFNCQPLAREIQVYSVPIDNILIHGPFINEHLVQEQDGILLVRCVMFDDSHTEINHCFGYIGRFFLGFRAAFPGFRAFWRQQIQMVFAAGRLVAHLAYGVIIICFEIICQRFDTAGFALVGITNGRHGFGKCDDKSTIHWLIITEIGNSIVERLRPRRRAVPVIRASV